MRRWWKSAGVGLAVTLLAAGSATVSAQTAAMTHFEMAKYTGKWYEMARLPNKAEKRCASDAIVLYAEGDKKGRFQFVASCRLKDGTTNVINKGGRAEDKLGDGKLQLRLFWPMWTKYWVLAVGPDYDWALVGAPNHKQLWVLSRQATLDPAAMTEIRAKAVSEGFAADKLVMSPQTPVSAGAAVGR